MTIHILLTLNNKYIEPSIVTLNSLFCNNRSASFHIHIIHYELTIESQNRLNSFILKNHALCSFYLIEDIDWANGKTRYWDKVILLKLFAWQVIPSQIKKIIYLDSDVLVLGNIRALWEIDLDAHYFAMRGNTETTDLSGVYAKHTPSGHTNYVIKRKRNDIHYNAGVIVMNLDVLRLESPQWKEFFLNNTYRLFCPEEHLICMLWYEKILPLEDKWNHIAQAQSYTSPIIIHYIPKPWSENKDAYYLKEYLQYCDIPECKTLYDKLLPRVNSPYPHSKEAFFSSWFHVEILNPNYLKNYLSKHNYKTVAIHGINTNTEILICKMSTQKYSRVVYFIDDKVDYRYYNELPVFRMAEQSEAPNVDCIIISDHESFLEIETRYSRLNISVPIVSLIEIIYS